MLTPSEATVLIPEVPAPITVVGARIMLLGASRTKPVPKSIFISAFRAKFLQHRQLYWFEKKITSVYSTVGKVGE